MTIVKGTFVQLLKPGLRRQLILGSCDYPYISHDNVYMERKERWDKMGKLHPDTSLIPIWRREPRRAEAPIPAYRFWQLGLSDEGYMLMSAVVDFAWTGPVARADRKPFDMSIWDKAKRASARKDIRYDREIAAASEVFKVTGIHALKYIEDAREAMQGYSCPIIGRVKLWGRVASFKIGYRAELCIIEKIWIVKSIQPSFQVQMGWWAKGWPINVMDTVTDNLARRYDCDVEVVRTTEDVPG